MPRQNPPSTLTHETILTKRIGHERDKRRMSYEGLAARVGLAGRPMQGSAACKIERGDPPRRITVHELMAFSLLLEIDPQDLRLPPELALQTEPRELVVPPNSNAGTAQLSERELLYNRERLRG